MIFILGRWEGSEGPFPPPQAPPSIPCCGALPFRIRGTAMRLGWKVVEEGIPQGRKRKW